MMAFPIAVNIECPECQKRHVFVHMKHGRLATGELVVYCDTAGCPLFHQVFAAPTASCSATGMRASELFREP